MEALGINIGYILLQLLLCGAPMLVVVGVMIWAALDLRKRDDLEGNTKLLWVLIIVAAPLLGAIAYFVFGRNDT